MGGTPAEEEEEKGGYLLSSTTITCYTVSTVDSCWAATRSGVTDFCATIQAGLLL